MLKPLRSCTRCRKNKIKCDSAVTRPGPCTACAKRNLPCTLDYVVPPRRSDELKKIRKGVSTVKSSVDRLLQNAITAAAYETCQSGDRATGAAKFEDGGCAGGCASDEETELADGLAAPGVTWSQIRKSLSALPPSRIMKISDDFFIRLMISEDSLLINNFKIGLSDLDEVLTDFVFIFRAVLPDEPLPTLKGVSELLESNELLLYLVSIINFYFDVPNVDYLEFYDHVCSNKKQYCVTQLWLFANVVLYGPTYFGSRVSRYTLPTSCGALQRQKMDGSGSNLRPAFAKLYYSAEYRFQCPKLYFLQERFAYFKDDPLLQLIHFDCRPHRISSGASTSMSLSQLTLCQYNDHR